VFFTQHKRKDGSLYPTEIHLQLVVEGNNKRFLAIVLDITERKKAEEENKFKANLLSTVGQAAIATNLDGVVKYWNTAAQNIYGWTPEEAIGKNIMELTTIATDEDEANQIMEKLVKGQTWSGEFKVRNKQGTNFPAFITNSPIYNDNNILSGIIGISSDITEEVKNKELLNQYTYELERSNEELEQFAFVASHDLQEPLRMISSFMELLQRKYEDQLDEKGHLYINFAIDGAKRMRQIILDLLAYSRASKPTEGKEEVDLNQLNLEYQQLRRQLISEKKAVIKSDHLPTLNTYRAAITQIFHCLLDNALKYSKGNLTPIIVIQVLENKSEWKFSIEDNGIGIDIEFFEKIFLIFQRLHNKDAYSGTGIGLTIAKRHVEFLGGRIWLESVPEKGSIFYFTIPK
jgi:PAS domain S-box-containing protein